LAKFGWDERRLFNVSESAFENLSGTPSDADAGQMLVYVKSDHLYRKKPTLSEVILVEDGLNVGTVPGGGSGGGVFKQVNSDAQLEFRKIVSTDGRLDIVENADTLAVTVDFSDINDDLDHGVLLGLGDDDHTQYLHLPGRGGGQVANGGTAASEDLELKSTADATKGYVKIVDGSRLRHDDRHMFQASVQTTDATETTAASLTLLDDKVYNVVVRVVTRRSDVGGEARASWQFQTTAYRAGGGATLQGSVKQEYKSSSAGALAADLDVDSNDLRVRVSGLAAQDFEWKAYVDYVESD
jgi:hypothetical protein